MSCHYCCVRALVTSCHLMHIRPDRAAAYFHAQTPLIGARTPAYGDMGGATPAHPGLESGSMTPAYSYGSRTPARQAFAPQTPSHDAWNPATPGGRTGRGERCICDCVSLYASCHVAHASLMLCCTPIVHAVSSRCFSSQPTYSICRLSRTSTYMLHAMPTVTCLCHVMSCHGM